jgi:hypothetical protein
VLRPLVARDVRFVVIGAIAAIAQGYPLTTQDVDVTPDRTPDNTERLALALSDLEATLRVPEGPGIPFPRDARMLAQADVWTLATRAGDLDIVYVPAGTQGYADLVRDSLEIDLGDGVLVRMASLADVIRSKEAAGRVKDQAQLPALRQTLEVIRERERRGR